MTGPLSEERTEALRESAKLVALHLLRVRAGADVQRRVRADLLSSALEGGAGAGEALERLGLVEPAAAGAGRRRSTSGDRGRRAATAPPSCTSASGSATRSRCTSARCTRGRRRPRSASVTYGLVPLAGPAGDAEERARADRSRTSWTGSGTGCPRSPRSGPVAPDLSGLAASRDCVDRALRVLREGRARAPGRPPRRAPGRGADPRAARPRRGPWRPADAARWRGWSSTTAGTAATWSRPCAPGWTRSATSSPPSDSVFVHPNTFRYRLRRVAEVGQIDLGDPDQRFAAMLQLRVLRVDARVDPMASDADDPSVAVVEAG